jgi:DNA end-binding protein Ku
MGRAIWSGAISFGLINIPVEVMGASAQKALNFHMLDSTDNSPIGYKKINKVTGREVPSKRIVKGYEYEKDQFVIVKDEDFKRANPKATQTIDIEDFVELENVDLLMFEKPYYLVPSKNGQKGYLLLRRVLEETQKVAIAKFVMRSKQHLVAIIPRGPYLILETLRYAHEVKEVEDAKYFNEKEIDKIRISPKELKMAEELVAGMTSSWKPEKYKDTYQDDLLKFINKKIKNGDVEEAAEVEDADTDESAGNVVNLMPLLEKSLLAAGSAGHRSRTKKKTTRSAARKAE